MENDTQENRPREDRPSIGEQLSLRQIVRETEDQDQ